MLCGDLRGLKCDRPGEVLQYNRLMNQAFLERLRTDLASLRTQGLYKSERVIAGPQGAIVQAADREVINLCANNYLGLANHPAVRAAAERAVAELGYGMASVRFICGTQQIHKTLEERLARYLGTEDAILYSSCFDANGGLFETLLDERDAVISDALNHASIIDGIRLCKAQRYRYANSDMGELEQRLREAQGARTRLIATDGVFSMDGFIAKLREICDLAQKHDALVMVDDSHATGFMGAGGRGTPEHCGVAQRVDIITSTLGKALGGGSGGFVAARREVIEWLRQRSRPYLFSNSIPPVVAAATLAVLELLEQSPQLRTQLFENTRFFRAGLTAAGFDLKPGEHPIIPVMLGDAALAGKMADALLERGVYVIGFSYPVVPKGQARIRTQMSAALSRPQLERALAAFSAVGRELGVIR
jgi:glycine C-acetyltransferase